MNRLGVHSFLQLRKFYKMELMEVTDVLDVIHELARVPTVASAFITPVHGEKGVTHIQIESKWSQMDLAANCNSSFIKGQTVTIPGRNDLTDKMKLLHADTISPMNEMARRYSGGGHKMAIVRKTPIGKRGSAAKPGDPVEFLQIFNRKSALIEASINLAASKKHGALIVGGDGIGCMEWSHGEGHLVYLAERKTKRVGYTDPEFDVSAAEESLETPSVGEEYLWEQSWGERNGSVKTGVVCVIECITGNVSILENIPENLQVSEAVWLPDDSGFLLVALDCSPIKLGITYCFNRKSVLCHYSLSKATCSIIRDENTCIRDIRLTPDNKGFVFVERPVGGPHQGGILLNHYSLENLTCSTIVDVVNDPGEFEFPGLYAVAIPRRCWSQDGKQLYLTSIWRSNSEILSINLQNRNVSRLTNVGNLHGSWNVLDVHSGVLLASCSAPNRAPSLLITSIEKGITQGQPPVWARLDDESFSHQILTNFSWNILAFNRGAEDDELESYVDCQYEGILLQPDLEKGTPRPLLVIPHGGPHSVYTSAYVPANAMWTSLGFAVLRINYRGSIGFGENNLKSLAGNVGTLDVRDCQHAVQTVLDGGFDLDPSNVFVSGGSHGGFLATHLIGQYPDFYRACIAANPVLNIALMTSCTDIVDWCVYENSGEEFEMGEPISPEQLTAMWNKSPIRYAKNVKTPVLFQIGAKDLRVPPDQRHEFHRILKANGVETRVHEYPDSNHAIEETDASMDTAINAVMWCVSHLKK